MQLPVWPSRWGSTSSSPAANGQPLLDAVASGAVDEALIDRAAERVLRQKVELGLLDPGWDPEPSALQSDPITLDDNGLRALAKRLAQRSVVLLSNDGTLPLAKGRRISVVGPRADE